jgi:hypothetical protein
MPGGQPLALRHMTVDGKCQGLAGYGAWHVPARTMLAPCSTMSGVTPAVRADLAPTGKLRPGINERER